MLVNIKINGKDYQADSSLTILKVARRYHIHIPTLCYMFHEESNLEHKPASCRVCVVEVKGKRRHYEKSMDLSSGNDDSASVRLSGKRRYGSGLRR